MPPKIRYVGQLTSEADLKPSATPMQAIGRLLVGREPPEPLYGPRAVLPLAREGRVWVADTGGRCLHLFDLQRRRYIKIVSAGKTRLLSPVGLCRGPKESMYVCDAERGAIFRLSSKTGAFIEELALPEALQRPVGVYFDEASRELFIVDSSAHDIKVVGPDGMLRRVIGRRGAGPGEFNFPLAVAGDGELIWVVDTGNHRIQGLTPWGKPVVVFGRAGDAPGDMALPKGIAFDREGHIYVVDARFENVQIFDRSGRLLLFFGQEGRGPGEFWLPGGIAIDANDRIWVCDSYNGRVQVFRFVGQPSEEESPNQEVRRTGGFQ